MAMSRNQSRQQSMEMSPQYANSHSDTQFPNILCYPKFLPCSRYPATGPCPEPDESSPHNLWDPF
jgi:hypothetical protein